MDLNPLQTMTGFYSNPQQSQLQRVCNSIPTTMLISLVATMSLLPFGQQLFVRIFILQCITFTGQVKAFTA